MVDHVPRTLDAGELAALEDLAALTVGVLELRRLQHEEARRQAATVRGLEGIWQDRLAQVLGAVDTELLENPTAQGVLNVVGLLHTAVSADWSGVVQFSEGGVRVQAVHARAGLQVAAARLEDHLMVADSPLAQQLSGLQRPLYEDAYALHPDAAPFVPELVTRVQSAAWLPLATGETPTVMVFLRLAGPSERSWVAPDRALLEAAARMVGQALKTAVSSRGGRDGS